MSGGGELVGVGAERDVDAVIAHGLLNTLAVVTGAAHLLVDDNRGQAGDQTPMLVALMASHLDTFNEGLTALLSHCSVAFVDAGNRLALIAKTFLQLPVAERPVVLAGLLGSAATLHTGLFALVRGLPPEVVELLDSLQRRPADG